MNHYIILTSGIFEMGGAEKYTANKCTYLKSKGWDVQVYYYRKFGELKIKELSEFQNNHIPELLYGFTYIRKPRRKEIINFICRNVVYGDKVVVESHIINLSYWGEMIAQRCNGISIINAMEEHIHALTEKEAAFVEFKLKRAEILNASKNSLRNYFGNRYKEGYANYTHNYMGVFCSNVVGDNEVEIDVPIRGQNIMSIGRLDKPYVIPMFKEILNFVRQNDGKHYNILVVGGSPDGAVENNIKSIFEGVNNVSLYLYGYLYPIPLKLINVTDVNIATANSTLVTANQGIPTIALDIKDLQPIGILGRTTEHRFWRDKEPIVKIPYLLDQILNQNLFTRTEPKEIDMAAEIERIFGRQVDFLKLSPNNGVYYDVEHVYPRRKYLLNQIKYFIHKWIR